MTLCTHTIKQVATSLLGATLLACTSIASASASEEAIRVYLDHARILKLDRAVSKVIIGNSEVADATVADSRTIVLTGKANGSTNLVILDQAGEAIVDERILVTVDEANTLRVYRQTARDMFSCAPICEKR